MVFTMKACTQHTDMPRSEFGSTDTCEDKWDLSTAWGPSLSPGGHTDKIIPGPESFKQNVTI